MKNYRNLSWRKNIGFGDGEKDKKNVNMNMLSWKKEKKMKKKKKSWCIGGVDMKLKKKLNIKKIMCMLNL